jgi:hypothetical protein
MSPRTACRERVVSFAPSPCAGVDAPLAAMAWGSASLRFEAEGELGAGGSDGGVRVPLAAAMVTFAGCWRCASDAVGWNALRTARVVLSRSPSQHALAAISEGARLELEEARNRIQHGSR